MHIVSGLGGDDLPGMSKPVVWKENKTKKKKKKKKNHIHYIIKKSVDLSSYFSQKKKKKKKEALPFHAIGHLRRQIARNVKCQSLFSAENKLAQSGKG